MRSIFRRAQTKDWIKSRPQRMSSSAMILESDDGRVLIVKANYKPYWTFPGGIIDPGETPKEGAVRETFEEVGLKISPDAVSFVAVVNRKSSIAETYQFIFTARLENDMLEQIALQSSEIDEYVLATRSQVASSDLRYGKVIEHWAQRRTGYIEQTFGSGDE